MTVAVIVTMWVSLTLFGLGLLAAEQVDLFKGDWYDRIEISVFMCSPDSRSQNCTEGASASDAERTAVELTLRNNSEVLDIYYESKAEAFLEFQKIYADNPIMAAMDEERMQDYFRVKLVNPEEYKGVVTAVQGLKGVDAVQDLRKYLDPLFSWLNLARVATIGASTLLLVAAALQIGNTIRLAAFSRRREIGIMRLVGASNWYIMLPFLLESLTAALGGALFACLSLASLEKFVIKDKAALEMVSVRWIDWPEVQVSMVWLVVVGVLLAVVPTVLATRRFLKV
jgi:cell division transport system permease protein